MSVSYVRHTKSGKRNDEALRHYLSSEPVNDILCRNSLEVSSLLSEGAQGMSLLCIIVRLVQCGDCSKRRDGSSSVNNPSAFHFHSPNSKATDPRCHNLLTFSDRLMVSSVDGSSILIVRIPPMSETRVDYISRGREESHPKRPSRWSQRL